MKKLLVLLLLSATSCFAISIDLRSREAVQILNGTPDFVGIVDGLLIENGNPPPAGGTKPYPNFQVSRRTGLLMSDTNYSSFMTFGDQNPNMELTGVLLQVPKGDTASVLVGYNPNGVNGTGVFETVKGERGNEFVEFSSPLKGTEISGSYLHVIGFTQVDPPSKVPDGGSAWLLLALGLIPLVKLKKCA